MLYTTAIFDLDGVVVDTARFHYQAWKMLADELGIDFTEVDNELLKGVSRDQSLEILLKLGEIKVDANKKYNYAMEKNNRYVQMLQTLTHRDILPGARELLSVLRTNGIRIALGSASKNAAFILNKLAIDNLFDVVVDGTMVQQAKPDPQVFLLGAEFTKTEPSRCVVFEDSAAGVEAANAACMCSVGLGNSAQMTAARIFLPDLTHWHEVLSLFGIGDCDDTAKSKTILSRKRCT